MRIGRFAAILSLAACMLVPTSSFACENVIGWANPDASVSAISMTDFMTKAQTELGVDIARSSRQAMCGETTHFDVIDHNTKRYLARIPVPLTKDDSNNGRILSARVNQLLKTPREQLISIQDAYRAFHNDSRALENELGIFASGGLWVNTRQREGKWMTFMRAHNLAPIDEVPIVQDYLVDVKLSIHCSSSGMREGPWTVYGGLAIKTIEYIPGRTDYATNTIYQRGDLRKAIFMNSDVMEALKKNLPDNIQYCPRDYDRPLRWANVLERLNGPQSELIKIDPPPASGNAQP